MKKGGSFLKERFLFFSVVKGGVDPRNPPVRTPLTPAPETVTVRKNDFALKTKRFHFFCNRQRQAQRTSKV